MEGDGDRGQSAQQQLTNGHKSRIFPWTVYTANATKKTTIKMPANQNGFFVRKWREMELEFEQLTQHTMTSDKGAQRASCRRPTILLNHPKMTYVWPYLPSALPHEFKTDRLRIIEMYPSQFRRHLWGTKWGGFVTNSGAITSTVYLMLGTNAQLKGEQDALNCLQLPTLLFS